MFVDLKLEESELDVLEYCVEEVLSKWEENYKESCQNIQIQKNPLALEILGYTEEWIDMMKSILNKIEPLKETIEKQYED